MSSSSVTTVTPRGIRQRTNEIHHRTCPAVADVKEKLDHPPLHDPDSNETELKVFC